MRTARAKGLSNKRVIFRHAFRTALIPVVTLMAIDFGAAARRRRSSPRRSSSGRAWARCFYNAVLRDIDVNIGHGLPAWSRPLLVIVFNILADIVYAYLDPRIRFD